MVNKNCHDIGNSSTKGDYRRVLVKLMPFQSKGRGNFQKNAMPSFTSDSKSPLYELSNDVSFV